MTSSFLHSLQVTTDQQQTSQLLVLGNDELLFVFITILANISSVCSFNSREFTT